MRLLAVADVDLDVGCDMYSTAAKKRDEVDTALVQSGGWAQACGGVETRATLLYSWLCGIHPSPGTARGRVTH